MMTKNMKEKNLLGIWPKLVELDKKLVPGTQDLDKWFAWAAKEYLNYSISPAGVLLMSRTMASRIIDAHLSPPFDWGVQIQKAINSDDREPT